MDATRLGFGDGCFDSVICIESAFHFDTRERFLREAFRVLKPGGRLVLSDILFHRLPKNRHVPKGNYVRSLEAYRDIYLGVGFQKVEIVKATKECWRGFRRHLLRWAWRKALERKSGISALHRLRGLIAIASRTALLSIVIRHYVLVSAKKA